MNSKEAIESLRATRDETLSLQNLDKKDHKLQLDIMKTCEMGLDKFNWTGMYYGEDRTASIPLKTIIFDNNVARQDYEPLPVRDRATLERLDEGIRATQFMQGDEKDTEFYDFVINPSKQSEDRASISHAERESAIEDLGLYGALYSVLRDTRYMTAKELTVLSEADPEAASVELMNLSEKQEIQDRMACYHARAKEKEIDPELRTIFLQDIYEKLRKMRIGACTTGYQLGELNEMQKLLGGEDRKDEIDRAMKAFSKDFGLREEAGHILQPNHLGCVQSGHSRPSYQALDQLAEELEKGIETRLYPREKERIETLAAAYHIGCDLSSTAFCAASLGEESVASPAIIDVAGLLETRLYPEKDLDRDMKELFPHADMDSIMQKAQACRSKKSIFYPFVEKKRDQFAVEHKDALRMQKMQEGDLSPFYESFQQCAEALTEQAKAAEIVARKTVKAFAQSAGNLLGKKLSMPGDSRQTGR